MKTSKVLKEERASELTKQQNLISVAKSEKRELSTEDETRFDTLQSNIEDYDVKIERAEKIEASEKRQAASQGKSFGAPAIIKSTKNEQFSLVRSLHALASGKKLTGIDAEVNERGISEMEAQKMEVGDGLRIHLPADMMRAQTITGDSGTKGAAIVASEPQFVMPLTPNIDTLANLGVNQMTGLVGDVPLPTSGLFSFDYVGETADVTETDITFAGPTLKPKRCAGVGGVSNQFLKQASFSVEQHLISIINNAYGAAVVKAFINGGGGTAPSGLYSLITSNIDTTATGPTKAIITELEALVDAANGSNGSRGYLSDTKLANAMKNTLLDAGSGRFLYDGADLNGYKYERSTLMDTLDVGVSHPLIFGDFSQASVGLWGNVSIMVDPYTLASSSKVRLIIEGFSDVAVTNESAFAINKVLTV